MDSLRYREILKSELRHDLGIELEKVKEHTISCMERVCARESLVLDFKRKFNKFFWEREQVSELKDIEYFIPTVQAETLGHVDLPFINGIYNLSSCTMKAYEPKDFVISRIKYILDLERDTTDIIR